MGRGKKKYVAITPKEYKKVASPEWIQVPSGGHFLVSGMPPRCVGRLIKVLGIKGPEVKLNRGAILDNLDKVRDVLLPECVKEPTLIVGTTTDEAIGTEDLLTADIIALIDTAITKTGLSPLEERERASFR